MHYHKDSTTLTLVYHIDRMGEEHKHYSAPGLNTKCCKQYSHYCQRQCVNGSIVFTRPTHKREREREIHYATKIISNLLSLHDSIISFLQGLEFH